VARQRRLLGEQPADDGAGRCHLLRRDRARDDEGAVLGERPQFLVEEHPPKVGRSHPGRRTNITTSATTSTTVVIVDLHIQVSG
jgi:hypothetical protein